MHISRKSDYALRALAFIAGQRPDKKSSISEIAESESIPRDFLAKILKELTRAGILKSFQGVTGGYQLARPRETISFLNVIEAMEGPLQVNLCAGADGDCGCSRFADCNMKGFWDRVQNGLAKTLSETNFGDPTVIS
jgi:Rrf2 family iron-sulfur cluster assembly transcriptional regulator